MLLTHKYTEVGLIPLPFVLVEKEHIFFSQFLTQVGAKSKE